ncbi:hypothetical protein GU243_20725 [Pseudarthrobacter psychrotolerans]|uniref:Cardiolipin synthase N-terminal domain-containing protein n=1 Tax=Pseudarthrobacter psychrotolerans TaxID=2697569 RepID=A0A6P1NPS6_9MICC|nr:PLDc N-terminal domain-containing protein [Pseudarthrobacter psychrotolerans]QHK21709.1 hypothetical protein GU243_20725 [Pseudarthrobacter psychrotolerans]
MAKKTKKTWKEMPPAARVGFVVVGIAQVSLMLAAQWDISKRPADQINGPKAAWRVAALINFIGPMGYFILGRKRPGAGAGAVK